MDEKKEVGLDKLLLLNHTSVHFECWNNGCPDFFPKKESYPLNKLLNYNKLDIDQTKKNLQVMNNPVS